MITISGKVFEGAWGSFGGIPVGAASQDFTLSFDETKVDPESKAALSTLLGATTVPTPVTVESAAAQLTVAEIEQALAKRIQAGGN